MKALLACLASLACALGLVPERAYAQALPLTVEAFECRGNTVTPCSYVLEHLDLTIGAAIDEIAVDNARYRLAALPNFASVDIYLLRGASKGQARVVVEVVERDPIATEFVAASAYYLASVTQRLAGRVAHQNVFGTGEIVEALVDARIPLHEPDRRWFHARVQYVDPHLAGSRRYYFIAGISTVDGRTEERNGSRFIAEESGVDLAIGRRFADFSYVAVGYRYNWESSSSTYICYRNTPCDFDDLARENIISLSYGWNSEDDPYFPTQGSRFVAGVQVEGNSNGTLVTGGIGFRKTWRTESGSLLTINAGGMPGTEYRSSLEENPAFGFSYARPMVGNERFGLIRGRWYVTSGWDQVELSAGDSNEVYSRIGVKTGVRLETRSFGIVDLYLMAVRETTWVWGG